MGQQVIIERASGERFGVAIEDARRLYPDATVISNADGSAYRASGNLSADNALAGELDNPQTLATDADEAAEATRLATVAAENAAAHPTGALSDPGEGKAAAKPAKAPDGA
jgi:hypothetical protein